MWSLYHARKPRNSSSDLTTVMASSFTIATTPQRQSHNTTTIQQHRRRRRRRQQQQQLRSHFGSRLESPCVTFVLLRRHSWTSPAGGTPMEEPHGDGGSAGCARGGDTRSSRLLRPRPRSRTTAHSARRRPGPGGGGRELKYTAAFRKMPPPPPRRLVPNTSRWTTGRTWERHQPPGGQHR